MGQAEYWLIVRQGPGPNRKIDLPDDEGVIGRGPSAGIVIASPVVSRWQVRLWIASPTAELKKLPVFPPTPAAPTNGGCIRIDNFQVENGQYAVHHHTFNHQEQISGTTDFRDARAFYF